MPKGIKLLLLPFATLLLLSTSVSANQGETKLKVVATTGMIADAVRAIGKNLVDVESLMSPGVDPHLYKPTRKDIAAVLSADMVFYNGLYLEGKMIDALKRAAKSGRRVYAVAELVSKDNLITTDTYSGQFDPHLWMDPVTWLEVVKVVEDKLLMALPTHSASIVENSRGYQKNIRDIHEYSLKALLAIPKEKRILVTAHDAFNYFGKRYGFEVVGIQGLSTESEAGVRDIERIIDILVSKKIAAVFIESTVSDKNIKALLEGALVRGHKVVIGGSLFSDAMGTAGTYPGTYIGMIDHNVTVIARSLGGEAAVNGFLGKLRLEK